MERPKEDKSEGPILSRLEKMRQDRKNDEYQPDMPEVDCAEHLGSYLFEIGPTMPAGMGPSAITNQEVIAWQALSGIKLLPWEAQFLRRLSREYVAELHRAEKAGAPAPWQPAEYVPDLSGVAMGMRNSIAKLAAR